MNNLIKQIRNELRISQEEFARQLGVSPVTVSRWENGKAKPTLMAQNMMYEMYAENKLDLSDIIIEYMVTETEDDTLFHGSRKGIKGEITPTSRKRCDFGRGFYMGTDPIQPLTLICNEDKPIFYQLKTDFTGLKILNVDKGLDWAMLIAYFRGYMDDAAQSPIFEKYSHMTDGYDVITGYIADDRMYQVLTDFFERRITENALIASLSALKLGKQYVAVTKEACSRIDIINEKVLNRLELLILKDKSEIRRREGISLAEKMIIEHRRDGRYFDEILKGVEG